MDLRKTVVTGDRLVERQVKVGVLGAGYWGPKLIRNFHEIPSADMVMVCDLRQERLAHIRELYPAVRVTTDYQELLRSDVEAVAIATPIPTHHRLAREALLAGKHVLVEKPLTANSEEAEDLVNLAERRGLSLMVGHTFEYNPAVEYLRRIIAAGELGRIYYINATRVNLGIFQPDINVVWDLAPHDVSILLFILGMLPVNVSARGAAYVRPKIHDVAYLTLHFPNEIMADIRVSWLDPCKIRRITVVGSKKMVVYDDVEPTEKIKIYDKGVDVPPYSDTLEEFHLSYRYGDITTPAIPNVEPLRVECEHFLHCVRTGERPRSDGRDGLEVVRILEAATRSLLNGGMRERVRL
ncbi:MAG: Gfo/Idh/MocA family oxidoreductase [Chloroflexi bacterium]|nr:Gfo/Idh/MocA family oxidoreductase [Chloroflexota bacterium]